MAKAVADCVGEPHGGFATDGSEISGFSHMVSCLHTISIRRPEADLGCLKKHDSGTGGVSYIKVSDTE